jgi:phosphate-selective porin
MGGFMRKATALISVGMVLLALPSQASPQVVTAAQVNGTWKDRTKIFRIWALGNQRLKVEFQGTYEYKARGGWTANTGEARGTAIIEGIVATFKPEGADEGCKITMTFKRDRLVVNQKDGCGFGLNVVASGNYRKTSSLKPDFDN